MDWSSSCYSRLRWYGAEHLYSLPTGYRSLSIGCSCLDEAEHIDFRGARKWQPWLFRVFSGPKTVTTLHFSSSLWYVQYPMAKKTSFRLYSIQKKWLFQNFFIFVGDEYLRHVRYRLNVNIKVHNILQTRSHYVRPERPNIVSVMLDLIKAKRIQYI